MGCVFASGANSDGTFFKVKVCATRKRLLSVKAVMEAINLSPLARVTYSLKKENTTKIRQIHIVKRDPARTLGFYLLQRQQHPHAFVQRSSPRGSRQIACSASVARRVIDRRVFLYV